MNSNSSDNLTHYQLNFNTVLTSLTYTQHIQVDAAKKIRLQFWTAFKGRAKCTDRFQFAILM
jgi:hypothetical protein